MTELETALAALDPLSKFIVNYGIIVSYALLGVAILLMLVFPAIQMFQDFKKALTAIAGVVALFLLFMLCYWLSAGVDFSVTQGNGSIEVIPAGTMRMVEACIYMLYLMLAGAIFILITTSFARYLK